MELSNDLIGVFFAESYDVLALCKGYHHVPAEQLRVANRHGTDGVVSQASQATFLVDDPDERVKRAAYGFDISADGLLQVVQIEDTAGFAFKGLDCVIRRN